MALRPTLAAVLVPLAFGAATVAVPATPARAKKPPKPLVYSEHYSEKLVKFDEDGETWWEVESRCTTACTYTLPIPAELLEGLSSADGATFLSLQIGEFEFEDSLDSDPKWTEGKTKAKWSYREEDDEGNPVGKPYLTVTANWKGPNLKVTVKGSMDTMLSDDYIGEPAKISGDEFDSWLGFGDLEWDLAGTVSGKVSLRVLTKEEEEFDINKCDLRGTAVLSTGEEDAEAPDLDVTEPVDSAFYDAPIDVEFHASDNLEISSITWNLDGGTEHVLESWETTPDGFGGVTVDAGFLCDPVTTDTHTLTITVTDGAGNSTSISVTFDYDSSGL